MFLRIGTFYFFTFFFLMLLGGTQQATGILPAEVGLAQWGPGVAAFAMMLIFRKDGFKLNFFDKNIPAKRYLWALLPLGVGIIVYILRLLLPINVSAVPAVYDNLTLVLLWMPLGALGEEIGWRGYLHKKLAPKMRGWVSSLIVGILWVPIHIHFFGQGLVFMFFFALMLTSYSIVLYVLVQDFNFNILLAMIFHWAVNLSNMLFLDVIYELPFMILNSLVWLVVAGVTISRNRALFFAKQTCFITEI